MCSDVPHRGSSLETGLVLINCTLQHSVASEEQFITTMFGGRRPRQGCTPPAAGERGAFLSSLIIRLHVVKSVK